LGHSAAELVAAHVAGVLSLPQACRVVAARARLMQALPSGGVVVALAGSLEQVEPLLQPGVGIAALNGPRSVVVSGDEPAVEQVVSRWSGKWRRLPVSHAFHSHLMEPMLADFAVAIDGLQFTDGRIPVVSNLTGRPERLDAEYWVRQIREPVRFADGITYAIAEGVEVLLELGPDSVLAGPISEALPDNVAVVTTLRHGRGEVESLLTALARLHAHGITADWPALFADTPTRPADLPTY